SLNRSRAGITVSACAREAGKSAGFLVYPNPGSDMVNVEFNSENAGQYRMQLVDMAGRVVFSQDGEAMTGLNKFVLNVGEMAAGVYLLQTQNGSMNEVIRLIVE
ncbi:MAG: T9SS type A sorting domain-containing protein, partial [Methylophilaceae bacterium]